MPAYYTYLIASLPALQFGARPPFVFKQFLRNCTELIPAEDMQSLKSIPEVFSCKAKAVHPALKKWLSFEAALRNELVKVRSSRRHIDGAAYLRKSTYLDSSLAGNVMSAYRNPSLLESEKILDQFRWRFLEDLSAGHYFDLHCLLVYGLKLSLLEKWETINSADSAQILDELLCKKE